MSECGEVEIPKAFKALFTPARYKGYFGGRGAAKTYSFATALAMIAANEKKRVLCCREFQRSIRESVKFVLDAAIIRLGLQDRFVSTQYEIRGANGSQFIFEGLHHNVYTLQSLAGIDIAWVEEGQTISQHSLNILVPTIRDYGSELWFSWNPRNASDPVDSMFRGAKRAGDGTVPTPYQEWMVCKEVGYKDNPWFPEVLAAEMERDKARDPDKYSHIWLGNYASMSEARVFRNWRIGAMVVPNNARPYFGADWGFSVDPTVLVRCYVLPNKVLYVDAEVSEVGCSIENTPALFDRIDDGMARKWPIKADSAWPQTLHYVRSHGYPRITPARKGKNSVEEGVEFLKNHDIVVHPNCKRVIDELTLYSYETDDLTSEVLPVLADKDNHTIDALRYAVEDLRHAVSVVAPIVVTAPLDIFGSYNG